MANVLKTFYNSRIMVPHNVITRLYGNKVKRTRLPIDRELKATRESIAAKGFLRPLKPYTPPADVRTRLASLVAGSGLIGSPETPVSDPAVRFSLLSECFTDLGHAVPNSLLNSIETVGDLINFYETPVVTTTPFDAMKSAELPENLHVQYEYTRFSPETDTMFGGVSVFTKSSTLVTGLKYKKKYPGHKAKLSWP